MMGIGYPAQWSRLEIAFWSVLFSAIVLGGAFLIYKKEKQDREHARYLIEHGCQILLQSKTGRSVCQGRGYCHAEIATVYECSNGYKTEIK